MKLKHFIKVSNQDEILIDESVESFDRYEEKSLGTNNNGQLIIKNANMKHEGWYKCEAGNILGQIEAKMYLQVKSKICRAVLNRENMLISLCFEEKTEIIEPPMNISVTKGQSALFKCTVSKEDDVEIDLKWKFNDLDLDLTPISESSEQWQSSVNNYNHHDSSASKNLKLYKNGTLQIIEAKNTDIGTYRCEVMSINNLEAGWDSKTAFLNVVELPYAPTNLNAVLMMNEKRSANLSWQPSFDGNSALLKFIVQARINSFDQSLWQYESNGAASNVNEWFVIKDNVVTLYEQQQQFRDLSFGLEKQFKQVGYLFR